MISLILIVCFGTICYVVSTYFFGGSDSVYGDRLNGIEDFEYSDSDMNNFVKIVEENEEVLSVSTALIGKVIRVTTEFADTVSLEEAKKNAATYIEYIDPELLAYYDLNYTITSSEYILMGYKNSISLSIFWNNNTSFEVETEEEGE